MGLSRPGNHGVLQFLPCKGPFLLELTSLSSPVAPRCMAAWPLIQSKLRHAHRTSPLSAQAGSSALGAVRVGDGSLPRPAPPHSGRAGQRDPRLSRGALGAVGTAIVLWALVPLPAPPGGTVTQDWCGLPAGCLCVPQLSLPLHVGGEVPGRAFRPRGAGGGR